MKNFDVFGLDPALSKSLKYMKYNKPTPIQARVIPIALKGRDIIGTAQTGTGKTAAFAIPIVEKLMNDPEASALVLTPTRELGKQIIEIMHMLLGRKSSVRTAFIIGGASMSKQIQKLKERPRLVVGTPGRINDHLKRKTLKLHTTSFVVLDETDRMLDMGFSVQLDKIFEYLPEQRQTLMFSATLPNNIQKMAQNYLIDPERIAVGSTRDPAKNIEQQVIRVSDKQKYPELLHQLEARKGTVIIFVKTKYNTERLAKKLNNEGHSADAIHGDLKQSRRERVLKSFRDKKYRILVATDVAARGLDIPHIEHVINYDLPQVPEDYIHRIGRTARAGAKGQALCLVTDKDSRKWHAIEQLVNPEKKEIMQDNVKPKSNNKPKNKKKNDPKNKLDNKSNKKKKRRNRRRVKNKKKNYQSRPKKKAA
jgi:superfamily II DNA/RNA helicase